MIQSFSRLFVFLWLLALPSGASRWEKWGGGLGEVTVVRSGNAETGQKVALRWQSKLHADQAKVFDCRIDELGRLILVVNQVGNWNATKVAVVSIPWDKEMIFAIGEHGVSLKFDGNENWQFQLRWEEAIDLAEAIRTEYDAIQKEAKLRKTPGVPESPR